MKTVTSFADSFCLVQPQPKTHKATSTFCEIWESTRRDKYQIQSKCTKASEALLIS